MIQACCKRLSYSGGGSPDQNSFLHQSVVGIRATGQDRDILSIMRMSCLLPIHGRRLLVTLALLVVVAYAGFLLSKLYYNGQSSRPRPTSGESRPTSRWKLFGDAFISDEERTQPGVQRLSVEQGKQVRLLADSLLIRSGDVAVKELVRGLESSQVYCHTYPENEGVIQRKYAKFLEVLAIYTAFHKQKKNGEGTKRLIWICDVSKACGGLADRVRGVAYALILAMFVPEGVDFGLAQQPVWGAKLSATQHHRLAFVGCQWHSL